MGGRKIKLVGKVAIVTGAARGIGRGIALALAKEGADVVINDLSEEEAERVAEEVRALGRQALAVKADVTKSEEVNRMVRKSMKRFGKVDILVNNAGIFPPLSRLENILEEDWDAVFNVNAKGVFLCCKAVAPYMIAQKSGKIINISSMSGRHGRRSVWIPHYGASKAAVILFTQAIAIELAEHNINVNAVCPGFVWTEMWKKVGMEHEEKVPKYKGLSPEEVFKKFVSTHAPLRRGQIPEDIGAAVVFLASEDSKNITGQTINVCGGMDMD